MNHINKERYWGILKNILTEHYLIIKETNMIPKEGQQYIDGYLTAVRALDAIDYEELKTFIEKVHFEVLGMTIEERQSTTPFKYGELSDHLDIPSYIRRGIQLSL